MEDVDVLVVGAGPVGLQLGTELRRDGVAVSVIDRMPERGFFCKALGITPRTLEIFDELGIVERAIEAGLWLTGVETWVDGTMVPARSMRVPEQGLPFGSLSLAQYETERLLEAAFTAQGGDVHYGVALDSFVETGDAVEVHLSARDGEAHTLRCRWLVGCDGAHSTVRQALGLSYEGAQYPQTFALADVDVDWPFPRGPMYRFEWSDERRANTSVAAVPVRGSARRYRLSMIVPDDHTAALAGSAAPDFDTMCKLLLPVLPDGDYRSRMSAPRRLHEYVGRGRHTLLGYIDASGAHYDAFAGCCRAFAGVLPDASSAVLVTAPGCVVPHDERMTGVEDTNGEFAATFCAPGGAAWIVRPDGHIGWRSRAGSAEALDGWARVLRGE